MSVAYSELLARAQQRSDMENGIGAVAVAEWPSLITAAYFELWDLVANVFGEHWFTEAQFTITGTDDSFAVPTDFGRLRALDYQVGSLWQDVPPYSLSARNVVGSRTYRLMGSIVRIRPATLAPGTYNLIYEPDPVAFDGTVQYMDVALERWSELVVVSAAIKALIKEETDVGPLMAEKSLLISRIQASASRRDAGRPPVVNDVEERNGLSNIAGRWQYES